MKKTILTVLAVLSVGTVASVRADDSKSLTPAERNTALFASGAPVRISDVYYYNGYRYHHRGVRYYQKIRVRTYVNGVEYIRYERRPVYYYW